jgi:hypothetical protein
MVAAEVVNVFEVGFIFSSFLILQVGRNPKRGIALRLTTPHVKRRARFGNRGYPHCSNTLARYNSVIGSDRVPVLKR